jgi:hypothetical protein
MGKQISIIILALALVKASYAQTDNISGLRLDEQYRVLCIINYPNKAPVATVNLIIDPKDVDSLFIVPRNQSAEICKFMKVSSIWVVRPSLLVPLLTLGDVFHRFYIRPEDQHLPVRIDDWIIDNPETLIIDLNEIVSVVIVKKDGVDSVIDIVTQHPFTIRKVHKKP